MGDVLEITITVWDMITVDEYFEAKSDTEYHVRYNSLRKMVDLKGCLQVDLMKHVSLERMRKLWNTFRYSD
jgi:hypothetical protein